MSASDRTLPSLADAIAFEEPLLGEPAISQEVLGLFDQFQRPLLRYVRSFGFETHDAEDVVQEVFLALYRHLLQGRSRRNLPGWLFQVAHNLTVKQRRKRRHWWLLQSEPAHEAQRVDPAANPEERMADAERQGHWLRVLQALPERDRQCVLLRAEGMTYRDIAAALDVSLGTVAKSMTRALARLSVGTER
ncbi:MAG: sigma-70 family RNA polymerase sigma factor [Vicinamibacterales bacterium]